MPSPPPPMPPPPPTPPAGDASAGDECAELVVPNNGYAGWTYVRASPERGVDVAGATIAEHRLTATFTFAQCPERCKNNDFSPATPPLRRLSEPADVGTEMTGDFWGHGHRLPPDDDDNNDDDHYRCNGVVRHLDECYMKAGNTVPKTRRRRATARTCATMPRRSRRRRWCRLSSCPTPTPRPRP